jgi:hypothetical protein
MLRIVGKRVLSSVPEEILVDEILPKFVHFEVLNRILPYYGVADCGRRNTGYGVLDTGLNQYIEISACFSKRQTVLVSKYSVHRVNDPNVLIMGAAASSWAIGKKVQDLTVVTNGEIRGHLTKKLGLELISEEDASHIPVEKALKRAAKDYINCSG